MAITFGSENYGDIRVQDVMIDVDGTNLEEGIDIISMEDLTAVYEYLTSDECVAYALIAHEYEFLENGKRV